jgi:hypothetical protein
MAKVVASVASIVESRLAHLLAKVGVEYQNGFLRGRGCSDGIFLLKSVTRTNPSPNKRGLHCLSVLLTDPSDQMDAA